MKARDTLSIDKVWYTIPDKMENFTGERIDEADARQYIRTNFPSWQFNGVDVFNNMIIWCEETFGNDFIWDWDTFYFKEEKHKVFFLLRWT